jgi:hypothetical protein
MSDDAAPPPEPSKPPAGGGLQFDRAESVKASGDTATCGVCHGPLVEVYYLAGAAKVCESCRAAVQAELDKGSKAGRFFRATVFGTIAAVLGAFMYYAWVKLTNIHFALVAIIIGLAVGVAVKKGSDGRGGWVYQSMAMLLTYLSIVGMFVPEITEGLRGVLRKSQAAEEAKKDASPSGASTTDSTPAPAKAGLGGCVMGVMALVALTGVVLALAMAAPILNATQSPIFLLIIGFAVYEAWKINRRVRINFQGPFRLGGATLENRAGE